MAKKTVSAMVNDLRAGGARKTLLGIGPVSENVIRAAFRSAARHKNPPMFIASRNQIDADAFGGGYVRGWDQKRCREHMAATAEKRGLMAYTVDATELPTRLIPTKSRKRPIQGPDRPASIKKRTAQLAK